MPIISRCKAGATYCVYKRNSAFGFVSCGKDLDSTTAKPINGHGKACPFYVKMNVEVID